MDSCILVTPCSCLKPFQLNQTTLREYTMQNQTLDSHRSPSPYTHNQIPPELLSPQPPSARGSKGRRQLRPTTAQGKPIRTRSNKVNHLPLSSLKVCLTNGTYCLVYLHSSLSVINRALVLSTTISVPFQCLTICPTGYPYVTPSGASHEAPGESTDSV